MEISQAWMDRGWELLSENDMHTPWWYRGIEIVFGEDL